MTPIDVQTESSFEFSVLSETTKQDESTLGREELERMFGQSGNKDDMRQSVTELT